MALMVAAMIATTLSAPALAVTLYLSHAYGEFVDRGVVHAQVGVASGARLDCAAGVAVERAGPRFTLTARRAAAPGLPGDGASEPGPGPGEGRADGRAASSAPSPPPHGRRSGPADIMGLR